MAPLKQYLGALAATLALAGCQKTESLDHLSKGYFSVKPDTITVEVKLYCPSPGKNYKDLFVKNFSTVVVGGELLLDSDADGLSDRQEISSAAKFNISPLKSDTNEDFFSDFLMFTAGISIDQQTVLRCGDGGNVDDDLDGIVYRGQFVGLNNCEESRITLTDSKKFDTDGDSIPDYLELRCGLNPRNKSDALLDADADGITNIEECKMGTPIDESNLTRSVDKFAARYEIQTDAYSHPGCMRIVVSNLPVIDGSGSNLIGLYLVETDGNDQLSVFSDWIEVSDGANGRIYTKDAWPDANRTLPWRLTQPN